MVDKKELNRWRIIRPKKFLSGKCKGLNFVLQKFTYFCCIGYM